MITGRLENASEILPQSPGSDRCVSGIWDPASLPNANSFPWSTRQPAQSGPAKNHRIRL